MNTKKKTKQISKIFNDINSHLGIIPPSAYPIDLDPSIFMAVERDIKGGWVLIWNPKRFNKCPLSFKRFLILHEIGHIINQTEGFNNEYNAEKFALWALKKFYPKSYKNAYTYSKRRIIFAYYTLGNYKTYFQQFLSLYDLKKKKN